MAAFVTGDLHASIDIHKLSGRQFPLGKTLTKDDYLIVAGDFGLVWNFGAEELWWRDWLDNRPWTTLFVDGNHENHAALAELPVESWHGGLVHRVSPSILHLMRGQVFDICGSSLFVMGGGTSIDRASREEGKTWWPQEMPSDEELAAATENLDRHGWKVDYVVTHECASSQIASCYDDVVWQGADKLTEWFEGLEHRLLFKLWYFGHHHTDRVTSPDHRCLYYDIVRLGELRDVEA